VSQIIYSDPDLYGDPDESAEAYSRVAPYDYRGYLDVDTKDYPFSVYGFFRDELYYESIDDEPAYIEFDLYVDFDVSGYGSVFYGTFDLALRYNEGSLADPAFRTLDDESWSGTGFSGTVTLSTDGAGDLIESGTHVPLTFRFFTNAWNCDVDWSHTLTLDDVRVYDECGQLMAPSDYVLTSPNDFGAPIPEPSSLLLFVAGLASVAGLVRRHRIGARTSS
jgi:hypothetical protein